MIANLQRLVQQKQTYLNILYLLAAFPLGLVYFIFLVTCILTGISTSIIWIGVPLFLATVISWWYLAVFERTHTIALLHIPIPPMSLPKNTQKKLWLRIRELLSNPITWKALVYLLLKFPFGLVSLILLLNTSIIVFFLAIICLCSFLITFPCLWIFTSFTERSLLSARTTMLTQTMPLLLTGAGFTLSPLYILNGLAWLWGQFACTMLGMSTSAIRVAEAEALAEQERAKADRADRRRRELIVNVSHELRTPVASIRGHAEALLMDYAEGSRDNGTPSPETLQKYLTIVHREAVHLGTLVDDLLSLARTETNELHLSLAAIDVQTIVEEVYQTLMPLARRERQITLVRDIAPGLPSVTADFQRLLQILLNLVRNAITYTPEGGIVSINAVQADEEYLALSVIDTGFGIASEDLEYIFDRFYRTDASRTRSSGGFGLGLAIVRDFVLAMGGTISVESNIGEGSRFCIHLCIAP